MVNKPTEPVGNTRMGVADEKDSNFMPTCSECSTSFPSPGVVAVRGESAMANCRECHRRMGMVYYLLNSQL
jgi:hypothetical protein